MSPRLERAVSIARLAGDSTLEWFRSDSGYRLKADDSPVTKADIQAERLVRTELERHFPGEPVLGEEEGGVVSGEGWVTDPIDGTKSFIAGVPLYGTLLSYETGGRAELGVCYFPALGETVWAERGGGTWFQGSRVRVQEFVGLDRAIVSHGGSAGPVVQPLTEKCLALRGWTDAYGHVLVARGKIHAMVDLSVKHWDVSALSVIVEEAGGFFGDLHGRPGMSSQALSAVPEAVGPLLEVLAL